MESLPATWLSVAADVAVYALGCLLLGFAVHRWRRLAGNPLGPAALVAAYACAAALFVAPALFTPRHQVATDLICERLPWQGTDVCRDVRPANPLVSDPLLQMLPFRSLVNDRLRAGELPFWAHELGTGQPLLGNAQSAPFAPLHLLALPRPPLAALTLAAAWQLFLALLFTHALLRRLGAGHAGAAFAAVAFAFSTFSAVWLTYPLGMAMAWVPGLLVGILDLRRGARGGVTGTALCAAGLALSGHPETLAHAALVAAAVVAASLLVRQPAPRARYLAHLAVAAVLAFALAAPALLPFLDAVPDSQRAAVLDRAPGSLSPPFSARLLPPLADPLVYGSPRFGTWHGPWNFSELCSGWAGALTLALALAGAAWLGSRVLALLAAGALALLLALGVEPFISLLYAVPLIGDGAHGRLRFVWVLALAVAAGLTVDHLLKVLRRPRDEATRRDLLGPWLVAAALAVVAAGLLFLPPAFGGWERGWWIATLAGLAAAGAALAWPPLRRRAGVVFLAALALDLGLLGVPYQPALDPALALPSAATTPPALAALRHAAAGGPWRVAAEGWDFLPNLPALWDLWDVRGCDPMRPARAAVFESTRLMGLTAPSHQVQLLPGHVDYRTLDLLSVRWLLAPYRRTMPPPWRLLTHDAGGRVWENGAAVPLFFAPPEILAVRNPVDPSQVRRADPVRRVPVEGLWGELEADPAAPAAPRLLHQEGEVEIVAVTANGFRLRVRSPQGAGSMDGVVVASTVSDARGWRARIGSALGDDDEPLPLLRAHGAFLAFRAPPGEHQVTLRYRPPSWPLAVALFIAAVATLLALALVDRRRHGRPAPATTDAA